MADADRFLHHFCLLYKTMAEGWQSLRRKNPDENSGIYLPAILKPAACTACFYRRCVVQNARQTETLRFPCHQPGHAFLPYDVKTREAAACFAAIRKERHSPKMRGRYAASGFSAWDPRTASVAPHIHARGGRQVQHIPSLNCPLCSLCYGSAVSCTARKQIISQSFGPDPVQTIREG